MGLQLLSLKVEDFSAITNHVDIFELGDDLVGPPVPVCWPVSTREEAQTRLRVHMGKQLQRYIQDPSVNYLKVVDDLGSIVSVARWHWYPHGYSYETEAHWETYPETSLSEPWAKQFNIALNNFILGSRDAARCNWIWKDHPYWILMHMVTRPSQRGKGAARLLIQWGIERAEETGASAYLEAGVMGRPIYEKMGFQQVGELMELDLRPFGVETTFVMAKMAYLIGREDKEYRRRRMECFESHVNTVKRKPLFKIPREAKRPQRIPCVSNNFQGLENQFIDSTFSLSLHQTVR